MVMLAMTLPGWSCAHVGSVASKVNGAYPLSCSALANLSSAAASAGVPYWTRPTLSELGMFGSASRPIKSLSAVGGGKGAPVSVGDGVTVGGGLCGNGVGLDVELVSSLQPLSPSAATIVTAPRTAANVRCTRLISRAPRATTTRTPSTSASRLGSGRARTGRSGWQLCQERTLRCGGAYPLRPPRR